MNKILPYVLTTLIGFLVGIGASLWIKAQRPIPPPPAAMLEELKEAPVGAGNPTLAQNAARAAADPRNEEAFRQVKAEMDVFMQKVRDIKADFRTRLDAILTDTQREQVKRWHERPPMPPPPAAPATSGPEGRANMRPFFEGLDSTITIIMVPFSLERMDTDLTFTPEQKEAVHQLLLERRAKFLELVDTTPPPSFKLMKLAPPEVCPPAPEAAK